jgi:hypothetical protein
MKQWELVPIAKYHHASINDLMTLKMMPSPRYAPLVMMYTIVKTLRGEDVFAISLSSSTLISSSSSPRLMFLPSLPFDWCYSYCNMQHHDSIVWLALLFLSASCLFLFGGSISSSSSCSSLWSNSLYVTDVFLVSWKCHHMSHMEMI